MVRFFTVLALTAALSCAARAEGSPEAGLAYARSACAECHDIGLGGMLSPNSKAPSFGKIANTPGMTGAALLVILQSVHREMPDLMIPQKEKPGLIAYILSLKR